MNNTIKEEIKTFGELLTKHKVKIPIIQRDYVQGRVEYEKLRQNLLKALAEAIKNDEEIKLDFIYGSIEKDVFYPLDGQQRLTTLFLLHWYAVAKDSNKDIKDFLLNFTYEVRETSKKFCEKLAKEHVDITNINDGEKISNIIIDSPWFFLSWKKDPTIDAMLNTIDDINKYFKEIKNLSRKLIEGKNICFYYMEIKKLGLTDDLYIKLNARGKQLTAFENFKAKFEKHINDNQWDKDKTDAEKFFYKIDKDWTDLFWKYKIEHKIDDQFIHFISAIAMIQIAKEKFDDKKIATLQEKNDFVDENFFTETGYKYLYECFDIYAKINGNNEISLSFKGDLPFLDDDIFESLISKNVSYSAKVLFFAQTEYLRNNENFCRSSFLNWMRVIRNIILRGNKEQSGRKREIVRSPETFRGAINLINELSEGCNDIYQFLLDNNIKSQFAKEQIAEEKMKAELVQKSSENKEIIFKLEDTQFCKGRINFIFRCIGYTSEENHFDIETLEENHFDIETAKQIYDVIKKHLDSKGEFSDNLIRALLTIEHNGKYNYYEYWWSWWLAGNLTKRCLIENLEELEYCLFVSNFKEDFQEIFKKLMLKLVNKDIDVIIDEFDPPEDMENWKKRLIKEPELLEKYPSKYIALPDDEACCILLSSKRAKKNDADNKRIE